MSFWPLQVFQQKFAKSLLTLRTKIKEKQNKHVVIVVVVVVVVVVVAVVVVVVVSVVAAVVVVVAVVVSTAEWFLPELFWDIFIIIATFRASLFGESTSGGLKLGIVDLNKTRSRLQKGLVLDWCLFFKGQFSFIRQ